MGAESPKDECGLFGVWAPGEDVARLTYFGLFAQQHRGQESAGIAVSDGTNILVYKDLGLVSQVFNEATLTTLHGDLAIGHTRYSTTGSSTWDNAPPVFKTDGVRSIALGPNRNLVNTHELAELAGRRGTATTDTDVVTAMLAEQMATNGLEDAALQLLPTLDGAFSFVFMDERSVYAARDPLGIRPLSIGRLPNGFCFASETCALDIVGATLVRDVEPGELVRIDDRGLHSARSRRHLGPRSASSSSSTWRGPTRACWEGPCTRRAARWDDCWPRRRRSRRTWSSPCRRPRTPPRKAMRSSGVPYGDGLIREQLRGSDIHPAVAIPGPGVKLKLNPSRIDPRQAPCVVDDSHPSAAPRPGRSCRRCGGGSTEVHLRIPSPPIKWPCFYGIDMSRGRSWSRRTSRSESMRSWAPTRWSYLSPTGWSGGEVRRRMTSAARASTASIRSRSRSEPGSSCWKSSCSSRPVNAR